MEVLGDRVARRRAIHALYRAGLSDLPGLSFQEEAPGVFSNCWLTTVRLDPTTFGLDARTLRTRLRAARIEARPLWQPAHLSPAHRDAHRDALRLPCPLAEDLYANCLSLPSSSSSSDDDIARVIAEVRAAAGR